MKEITWGLMDSGPNSVTVDRLPVPPVFESLEKLIWPFEGPESQ